MKPKPYVGTMSGNQLARRVMRPDKDEERKIAEDMYRDHR